MIVLLSVKPRFAELIFSGEKRFEYRKAGFGRAVIDKVIVYASSPIKSIVGEFQIAEVMSGTPESIWERTSGDAGIDRECFFEYFSGRTRACAIRIEGAVRYPLPLDPRQRMPEFIPPQSFRYVKSEAWQPQTTYAPA